MKITKQTLFLIALLLGVSCSTYKRWSFEGEVLTESENHVASIEPVRIPENASVPASLGYDNGYWKATGMRLTYSSKSERQNRYAELKASYLKDNREERQMEVVYWEQNGSYGSPKNRLIAYLVPEGATEPPTREYDNAPITVPIQKGAYTVRVSFVENGEVKKLEFQFDYRYRVSYGRPDFDVSGKN